MDRGMHFIRIQGICSRTVKLSSQLHCRSFRVFIVFWLIVESSWYHTLTVICQETYRVKPPCLTFGHDTIRQTTYSCKHGSNVIISVDGQSLYNEMVFVDRSRPVYSSFPWCHFYIDQTVSASSSVSDASPVIRPAKCDTSRIL